MKNFEYFTTSKSEIEFKCETKCRRDCHNQFINFQINEKENNSGLEISLSIFHNQLPDQMIKHMPEMTFISFICSLGGLAGMWLGLSITSICNIFTLCLYKIFA